MKYIEIIILVNLAIHILIVKLSLFILRKKPKYIMIAISAVIDIIYVLFYLLYPYEIENYRYIFILLISITPFLSKEISKTLTLGCTYLMINFMLGGISEQIYLIVNSFYCVVITLAVIYIFIFIIFTSKRHKDKSLYYQIRITDGKKKYKYLGYCDTGNFITDESNIPIVFINKKIKVGNYKKTIKINSISNTNEVRLYEVDLFEIKINNKYLIKDVYLAYGNISFMVMFGLDILGG